MYRTLNSYLRERFGCKVYKLSLDGGMTCPNRDGTCGTKGCIFCTGSGEFAERGGSIAEQLERAKARVSAKVRNGKYIAYFQSFTNTYAPVDKLRCLFKEAIFGDDIAALSIGTRPDCLPDEVLDLLSELNGTKPVIVELGLQTIHPASAEYIRRGYDLSTYDKAVAALQKRGIETVVHMIAGIPGESKDMIVETARYIGDSGVQGIKIHLLHVLRGTDLETEYREGKISVFTLEEYISVLRDCIRVLPPEMVIHRLTGDGDKRTLIAPLWSGDKKRVLNMIRVALEPVVQGEAR